MPNLKKVKKEKCSACKKPYNPDFLNPSNGRCEMCEADWCDE